MHTNVPDLKILPSVEVRWFFHKEPADLVDWFETAFPNIKPEGPKPRDDWYLYFPGVVFAGVKLRPYNANPPTLNLEFKLRAFTVLTTFAPGVVGWMEGWQKWTSSINMSAADYRNKVTDSDGKWRHVGKDRRLATFRVQNGNIDLVEKGAELNQGCGLELTKLSGVGENWWTFGFEAFSKLEGADTTAVLRGTAERVFEANSPPPLEAGDSFSYPEWLAFRIQERVS